MTHVSQTSWLSGCVDMAKRRVLDRYYSPDCDVAGDCIYSCTLSSSILPEQLLLGMTIRAAQGC
jgi:hypothetical protein